MANQYKQEQQAKKASDLMERCKALIGQGKMIEAIKEYRAATGSSLQAAKAALAR